MPRTAPSHSLPLSLLICLVGVMNVAMNVAMAAEPSAAIITATIPSPASAPSGGESAWASPQAVARVFQQACLQNEGQAAGAVDWALAQGFEPVDPMRGSMDGLLSGQRGSVLVAPGSEGRVMLAAAEGQQCTVWAEQMNGPSLRVAVAEMLGTLGAKGAQVQLQADRSVERAGAWRNQMQWRYKAVGATQDFGLGAVTTLSPAPGTQALHMSPLAVAPAFAPDGIPTR